MGHPQLCVQSGPAPHRPLSKEFPPNASPKSPLFEVKALPPSCRYRCPDPAARSPNGRVSPPPLLPPAPRPGLRYRRTAEAAQRFPTAATPPRPRARTGPTTAQRNAARRSHAAQQRGAPTPAPPQLRTHPLPRAQHRGPAPTRPRRRSAEGPTPAPPPQLGVPSGRGAQQRLKEAAGPGPSLRAPCPRSPRPVGRVGPRRPARPRSPVDAIFSPSSSALPTSGRRGRPALRMRRPARRDAPLRRGGGGAGAESGGDSGSAAGGAAGGGAQGSPPALRSGWCGPPPLRSVAHGRCEGGGGATRGRGYGGRGYA